ncbi:MAG: sigma-70 family RNA polymerase sigma factor [Armatimonadota bacterium]
MLHLHCSASPLNCHTDALSAAVAANDDLVHWVVQRQVLGGLRYVDAVQEGRIALWRAIERYDPHRGRLSSYAVPAITRAVWNAVAREHRHMAERLPEIADQPLELAHDVDRTVASQLVRAQVAALPPRLRTVMILRYGLDGGAEWTYPEISHLLGVTRQRVQQLHTEAILHLADPVHSVALRRHLGRNTVADYQAFVARRRAWQRASRRRR